MRIRRVDNIGGMPSDLEIEIVYEVDQTDYNILGGSNSGDNLSSGTQNILLGRQSGRNIVGGNDNIFVGYQSGGITDSESSVSNYNVGIGYQCLGDIDGGDYNIALGYRSAYNLTTSSNNVCLGQSTLSSEGIGGNNIAIGAFALQNQTISNQNVAIGVFAGQGIALGGNSNIAIGYEALKSSGTVVTGDDNIVLGRKSGATLTSAKDSILIGRDSGASVTSNSNNVCIGYNTDIAAGKVNSVALGIGTIATASNQIRLGTSAEVISIPGQTIYLNGDADTDNTWKLEIDGANLSYYKRESGVWNKKSVINAA